MIFALRAFLRGCPDLGAGAPLLLDRALRAGDCSLAMEERAVTALYLDGGRRLCDRFLLTLRCPCRSDAERAESLRRLQRVADWLSAESAAGRFPDPGAQGRVFSLQSRPLGLWRVDETGGEGSYRIGIAVDWEKLSDRRATLPNEGQRILIEWEGRLWPLAAGIVSIERSDERQPILFYEEGEAAPAARQTAGGGLWLRAEGHRLESDETQRILLDWFRRAPGQARRVCYLPQAKRPYAEGWRGLAQLAVSAGKGEPGGPQELAFSFFFGRLPRPGVLLEREGAMHWFSEMR